MFDESQHVPDIFSYLQVMVDEDPAPGRFVLNGSQHFGLTERIGQSLAGRTSILELLPFTAQELLSGGWLPDDADRLIWGGGYPPVYDRRLRPDRWYANYLSTYVQRDVRQISQIQNLDLFTRFMRLCAGSCGQLANANRIGAECGVDNKTISRWLTVLQASYILRLLPPYHRSLRKRVIKTPKIYFYDTGLACHLLGIHVASQLPNHPLRGGLFENWVFTELVKGLSNRGLTPELSFWRTHGGQEVDFILEHGGKTHLVEVKSGMTVAPSVIARFKKTVLAWPEAEQQATIICGGDTPIRIHGIDVLPWTRVESLF